MGYRKDGGVQRVSGIIQNWRVECSYGWVVNYPSLPMRYFHPVYELPLPGNGGGSGPKGWDGNGNGN